MARAPMPEPEVEEEKVPEPEKEVSYHPLREAPEPVCMPIHVEEVVEVVHQPVVSYEAV